MGQFAIQVTEGVQAGFAAIDAQAHNFSEALIHQMKSVHAVAMKEIPLIAEFAENALLYFATALLFLSNSSIFVIGMCYGVVNDQAMRNMIRSIQEVVDRIMKEKDFTRLALMVTGSVLAWPITMAVSAFFLGGYYGWKLKNPGEPDHV